MIGQASSPDTYRYGATSGASYVVVVGTPLVGSVMIVAQIVIINRDSAAVTPSLWINNGNGTRTEIMRSVGLAVGNMVSTADYYPNGIPLRNPEYIEINLSGAVSATQPSWHASWTAPEMVYR